MSHIEGSVITPVNNTPTFSLLHLLPTDNPIVLDQLVGVKKCLPI